MNHSAFVAFAALAAAAIASGADAQPANNVMVRNVVVQYGDLNLETARGDAALHERIAEAAARACGGSPTFSSFYRDAPVFVTRDFEQCRTKAMSEALAEVSNGRPYAAR